MAQGGPVPVRDGDSDAVGSRGRRGRSAARRAEGTCSQTGVARWPKWRLFGYRADPEGTLDINLGEIKEPVALTLNYETDRTGGIRIEVPDTPGCGLDDAVPVQGDSAGARIAWKGGATIPARPGRQTIARLHLERATVWAYEMGKGGVSP